MSESELPPIVPNDEATATLSVSDRMKPITIIGNDQIRSTFDELCLRQAINSRLAPGVTDLILNPDAHGGCGAPVGCVLVSPTHIYPGPVGVDIKCSMSLLQTTLPSDAINDKGTRRALIQAICARTPTGAGRGQRQAPKSRHTNVQLGKRVLVEGASKYVCAELGIPFEWTARCEDSSHVGPNGTQSELADRLDRLQPAIFGFEEKIGQLGSYGGGNHFGECEVVRVVDNARARTTADVFGLRDNSVAFLSHCGSRGIGHRLATNQFKALQGKFSNWNIPLPGSDRELVYAPLGTLEADAYLCDMGLGANFATVNHLLINALILEAFQEVIPGVEGSLVYFISHNIARKEVINNKNVWVHRKGATRAYPAGHFSLRGTPFASTGHPILLPGNPQAGSVVMAADEGATKSCYSVNHGAGRRLGRMAAKQSLDQAEIDRSFADADILTNCRQYPTDEAPGAYKDFEAVLQSVKQAGLASEIARLQARFVIKDYAEADD